MSVPGMGEEDDAPEAKIVRPYRPKTNGNAAVALAVSEEFEDGPSEDELAEIRRTQAVRERLKLINGGF